MGTNKVALVTGANKGIGFETARQLAKRGIVVLVGARAPTLGEAAAATLRAEGADARFVAIDVTNQASIEAAARWIEREAGRLDVLVNNAGIARDRPRPSGCDVNALRQVFETNVFGVVAVTNAMLPLLRRAGSGARIVNVSSGLGSLSRASDPSSPTFNFFGYAASKAALNMVTLHFANELRDTGIKVNAAAPGFTATDMNAHTGTQTVEEGAEPSVFLATLPDDGPTGGFFGRQGQVPW